jgi:hypothetical protein
MGIGIGIGTATAADIDDVQLAAATSPRCAEGGAKRVAVSGYIYIRTQLRVAVVA